MLDDFERLGVDPCGENGEYHTVVTSSPLFREPLRLEFGEQVSRSGCWAMDVRVSETSLTPGCNASVADTLQDVAVSGSDPGLTPGCQRAVTEVLQKLHGA